MIPELLLQINQHLVEVLAALATKIVTELTFKAHKVSSPFLDDEFQLL